MLDDALAFCLVVLVPAYSFWREWRAQGKPPGARTQRYVRAIVMALGLSALLLVNWLLAGRSATDLGLDAPPSLRGLIGLGVSVCLLGAMGVSLRSKKHRSDDAIDAQAAAMFPQTKQELYVFIAFSLVIGTAWEVLYRGYLLWAFEPRVGFIGAVLIAAAAYGFAHGYKNWRLFVGSLLSALLFTLAYALTRSLWWLIVIHAGMALMAGLSHYWRTKS